MPVYPGKTVCQGIAIGKIRVIQKNQGILNIISSRDCEAELMRFENAIEEAKLQVRDLFHKAVGEVGKEEAAIFDMHILLMEDEDYITKITDMIRQENVTAEYAVSQAGEYFVSVFDNMQDEYLRERAADIKDVSERIINVLTGRKEEIFTSDQPVIIVAEDLTPSDTIQMDKSKILAFVTVHGSSNSHAAILARTLNIPAIFGVELSLEGLENRPAAVDGVEGRFYLEPDGAVIRELSEKQRLYQDKKANYRQLVGKETITPDGRKLHLYANIGNITDIQEAVKNDAEGIGLFRSEFLYMEKDHYPTEEEQFEAYKEVLTRMAGKRVIIRTMDIGADKQVGYFNLKNEDNPALGYRAIRICLDRKDIFKTQLRALLRAGIYGKLSIMYPMIISLSEVHEIKKIICEVKEELDNESLLYDKNTEQGIMIETPAAAIISDLLAKEVDFFSIGTNDLTQYTLAIDRQNPELENIYDPHHEAILRLIETVIKNAHHEGIWVGICGELGADISLTGRFVEMGIDELSVSPGMVLPVRDAVLHLS